MHAEVVAEDGCRLWTERAGDGLPLVFCHGGPGLWDYFGDVAGLLRGHVRTVRWDQRGCGRSEHRGPYTFARSIADLDAVRNQLAGPRMALLGHSWGADLALRYTLAHPDRVSALVYVSGNGIDRDRGWRAPYAQNLRRRLGTLQARWEELDARARTPTEEREWAVLQWSADFADPGTALEHAERMATPWLGINYDCHAGLSADQKLSGDLTALDVPVLIIDGPEDIRPRWAVDSLDRALPDSRRVSLAGAGHLPWVEDPDGFRRVVSDFLGR